MSQKVSISSFYYWNDIQEERCTFIEYVSQGTHAWVWGFEDDLNQDFCKDADFLYCWNSHTCC